MILENLKSKKSFKIILLLSVVIFLTFQFGTVLADNLNSDNFILKTDETHDGTAFFSGNDVDIKGTVDGTAFIRGNNINISGTVDGDLFIAGNNVTISGVINGSLTTASQNVVVTGNIGNNMYSAGSNITLNSETKGSAFLAGNKIIIEDKAKIEKDLFAGGSQIFQKGEVLGKFFGSSNNATISGIVGKNARIEAKDLYVESGEINGNLKYESVNEATISNDSKIAGKTEWDEVEPKPKKSILSLAVLISIIISIVNALIVWFLIKLIRPNLWTNLADNIGGNPLKTIGFGALALIVTPTAIFLLILSVFIYPVAFIIAALYAIAIYVSKIIVSVFIGQWFKKKFGWSYKHKGIWTTLLGLFIISALGIIPIVGLLVNILVIITGLGSIVLYANNK